MTDQSVIMPPKPAPAKTEDRRRRILDAARSLMVRQDFQGVVMEDVAREADVAKGTLYLYFRNKDELLAAAYEDLAERLGEALDALPGAGLQGEALLREAARIILGHFDRNKDFLAQMSAGRLAGCSAKTGGRALGKLADNAARIGRILARCADDGLLPAPRGTFPAAAFISLCRAAMVQKLLDRSAAPLEKEAPRVVAFFLHGLGSAA